MTTIALLLSLLSLPSAPVSAASCETFVKQGVATAYHVIVCGGSVKLGVL